MVSIVLVEDQVMMLGALAALLGAEEDFEVVATSSNGEEALAAVAKHQPDILVTDVEMPKMNGLDLATRVREKFPATKVMILTTFAQPGYLRRALESGVRGYLMKDRPVAELAEAIRQMHRGERSIDPVLAGTAWDVGPDPLTDREREVLREVAEGRSNLQVAKKLHISEGTVKNYLAEINAKLGTANRTEACAKARIVGWI